MKTSRVDDRSRNEPDNKNPVCWNKDAQTQVLRAELADGSFYLFPYGDLSVVKFEQTGEDDLLKVCFAAHEVQITGKQLRELGLAFQKLTVDWVKELPARYAATVNRDGVYISSIKVTETQNAQ